MAMQVTTSIDAHARHELLSRLRAVRRAGAAVAVTAGLSRATLTVLISVLLAIALDWLLRLPGPLRSAEMLALVLLGATTLNRHVLARLRLPPLSHVARQVQDSVDGPPDCLASGAEFAVAGLSGPFIEQTVTRSAHLARDLSPARLARWRWMTAWLGGALLALGILTIAWDSVGWWVDCGLQRLTWPVVRAEWPRRIRILSDLSGKTLLAATGEPLTLEARIARGSLGTDARLVLSDARQVRRVEMADSGDGKRSVVVRLLGSATFWFEAGDDDTRADPSRVRVVPRPAVSRAEILVQSPPYTAQPASRITLGSGPVQVPEGSRIDLQMALTKPLADEAGHPKATILLAPADSPDAQPVEALDVKFGSDHRQIAAGWWCIRDSLVKADFTDTDGFANAPLQPWRIAARIDQPPAVQVQSPADEIEVAPGAALQLQAMAADDWGIDDVQLAWRVTKADAADSAEHLQRIPTSQPQRSGDAVSLPIDWSWSLEGLALQPGDRLTWSLQVHDNFDLAGRRHDPVRSPPRTIRVVSEAELLESILQQLAASRGEVLQMLQQQRDLRETLLAQAAASQPAADPDASRRGMEQQARVASQARRTAGDLAKAADRLHANRVDRPNLSSSVASAARQLSQIQSSQMAEVQRNLQTAQASLPAAANAAAAAAKDLEDLLRRTAGWTSLEAAALGLEDLIDKQKALQAQTADLASRTLGQPVNALPGAERQALAATAAAQRDLSRRVEQLQKDMKSQAVGGESLQPDQKARLGAAAESLEKQNTAPAMAAGADEIARNVTMSAQQRQQAARQSMQQALASLRGLKASEETDAGQAGPNDSLARHLKELAAKQAALRAQTGDINARRDPSGSLDRAGLMRLNQASKGQADLGKQVRQAQPSAKGQAAQRLLDAVAGRMQGNAQEMQAGSSGQPVLDSQQHAAETLLALADALERAAQGGQGQQGSQPKQGASGSQQKANPSELEALYLLQQDLLLRTQRVSQAGAVEAMIQQLAKEQQQVRDLAQKVLSEQ